jgi:ABC-type branched-subunit amino acid transport system permease subunit
MDPLSAIVITVGFAGLAGAVYAAQIEARHHRQIGTDYHGDEPRRSRQRLPE